MRLRDLLKFEFYFADSAAFREHLAEEMSWHDGWEGTSPQAETSRRAAAGQTAADRGCDVAAVLRGYEIVADVLRDAPAEIAEKDLTKLPSASGGQYVAQNRVRSDESVSALLFATARQVVADQNLLKPAPDLVERRAAFLAEMRGILGDMDKVEQFSREQFFVRELVRDGRRAIGRSAPRHTLLA